MAFALQKDPDDDIRRHQFRLKIIMVTLGWLVTVPILLLYGWMTRDDVVFDVAAALTLLGPFVAAVIATKNRRPGVGALYVVLTLLMAFPAAAIARL